MYHHCFRNTKFPVVTVKQKRFFKSEHRRSPASSRASGRGVMWREGLYRRVKKAPEYK
jgi:hypothetical protein